MVELTRLHGDKIIVNADHIEFVEVTPDTMIITQTGKRVMVKETVQEVVEKVIEYRRQCLWNPQKENENASTDQGKPTFG
jgi:flagellar protein FlbD